jgi:hypothetical protein
MRRKQSKQTKEWMGTARIYQTVRTRRQPRKLQYYAALERRKGVCVWMYETRKQRRKTESKGEQVHFEEEALVK